MTRHSFLSFAVAGAAVTASLAAGPAQAQHAQPTVPRADSTPKERMARRFPQPVRVGFLIGLPILDESSGTVGRVKAVLRTREGDLSLIVAYGGVLGFGTRPIALPVEVVAMLGAHVVAIDMPRAEMDRAPDWLPGGETALGPDDVIHVALTRR